jgi:tRNA G37 N-methylase Trm5
MWASLALTSPLLVAQRVDVHAKSLAPFVPSPQHIVERMLEAASVKPGEVVYDLGCGDGRILITAAEKFNAKAVGVELSPDLVKRAQETIRLRKLENRAQVVQGNLVEVDLSNADVVVLYLLTESNELLRPRLEKQLRPGARVVSHDFEVRGWKPTVVDYVEAYKRKHRIYVYEITKR